MDEPVIKLVTVVCMVCTSTFETRYRGLKTPTKCSPECVREADRRRTKARREANGDYVRALSRASRARSRDRVRAQGRAWYARNAEKAKALSRQYRIDHPDRVDAVKRGWAEENRELWLANRRESSARRRARERAVPVVKFTRAELSARMAYFGNRCWMCGGPFENVDHVKPIAANGPHMLANLRPSCAPCNTSKAAKWPFSVEAVCADDSAVA